MKIRRIEINNWRSIVNTKIEFNDLMIFIGQNNHGKSNILSAILFFFGEIGLQDMDFNQGSSELWIEVEFSELTDSERVTFQKYVTASNTIKVRKTAIKGGAFSYHGYLEEPEEEWLKEDKYSDYKTKDAVKKLPLYGFLSEESRITKENFREAQKKYIEEHKDEISFSYTLESTNFLGVKNVAKGSLGDVFFIPSIKKAADELSPKSNSLFGQLYSRVISKIAETDENYKEAKRQIRELSKVLNKTTEDEQPNPNRPQELSLLENLLEEELKSWNSKIDIQIEPPNVDEIFKLGASVWIDDGVRTDIERKGHGLQRALIFALILAWAKTLKEENKVDSSEDTTVVSGRKGSKSAYFIFEEPELFLHPQAQKELFDSLVTLSKEESQIILCKHSSSFISLDYYRSICIVKKDDLSNGTKVLQCTEELFADGEQHKNFNLSYWINPERGELFFAKKVILVEGPTDKSVIPLLARKLGVFKYDFTLIDCGGKNNIPQYVKLLNNFRIPYTCVYDKDHQEHKTKGDKDSADKKSKLIEDCLEPTLGKSVVLVNDIEEEIGLKEKNSKNKAFVAIDHVASDEFIIEETLSEKIKVIYS